METRDFGAVVSSIDSRDTKNHDGYYQKLDAMSDVLVQLKDLLEKNPDMAMNDIFRIISTEEVFKKLDHESLAVLLAGVNTHFETKTSINALVEKFENDVEGLFTYVFGFKPQGRVELRIKNGYLGFILDDVDCQTISESTVLASLKPDGAASLGCYFPHGSSFSPPECQGKFFIVARNVNVSKSSQKKTYILNDEEEINSSINHEAGHAFWQDLVLPLKEKVVEEKRMDEEIDPVISDALEKALSGYFIGDNHLKKFISESGPMRLKARLRSGVKEEDVNKYPAGTIEFVIKRMVKEYRKLFFKLYDALGEIKGRIDPQKLEALAFLLPADRMERLLHFVGKDPEQWKKEWEKENTDERLKQKEEDLIIKFGY